MDKSKCFAQNDDRAPVEVLYPLTKYAFFRLQNDVVNPCEKGPARKKRFGFAFKSAMGEVANRLTVVVLIKTSHKLYPT
jgi:hypothetical protein